MIPQTSAPLRLLLAATLLALATGCDRLWETDNPPRAPLGLWETDNPPRR